MLPLHTNGKKFFSDKTEVPGQQFEYGFDNIGNRISSTVNARSSTYSANVLNQYQSRTVPGAVDIIGTAAKRCDGNDSSRLGGERREHSDRRTPRRLFLQRDCPQ